MVPESWFCPKLLERKTVSLQPQHLGYEFLQIRKTHICVARERLSKPKVLFEERGSVPLRLLFPKSSQLRLDSCPMLAGISPVRLFEFKALGAKRVRKSSSGMVEFSLDGSHRKSSICKLTISGGMVPPRLIAHKHLEETTG